MVPRMVMNQANSGLATVRFAGCVYYRQHPLDTATNVSRTARPDQDWSPPESTDACTAAREIPAGGYEQASSRLFFPQRFRTTMNEPHFDAPRPIRMRIH